MSGYFSTIIAFLALAVGLWLCNRKSPNRLVRVQWKRPGWILLRLFALVAIFHAICVLLGVHPAKGFVFLAGVSLALVAVDFSGAFALVVAALIQSLYEWIF